MEALSAGINWKSIATQLEDDDEIIFCEDDLVMLRLI